MSSPTARPRVTEPQAGIRSTERRALTLAQKLAFAFLGLVSAVLLINGAIDALFSWREGRDVAVRVQQEKADAAAEKVGQFITEIEGQMGWTTRAEWARVSVEQRRYDFIRLLRQSPAITELIQVDNQGREQLRLSRLEPDVIGSNADLSADPRVAGAIRDRAWYGPVTFRRGSEPYMAIGLAHTGRNSGATIAEVNLKLVWDVVTSIRVGTTGYAFVTDRNGKLIAHPDMSLVLRDTDLSHLPQVSAAIADLADGKLESLRVADGRGLDGRIELSAYAAVPKLGWLVFVDLPIAEAMAAVWTSIWRTLALMALGLLLAAAAGAWLARRLAAPILELKTGAQRFGEGVLSQRVAVRSNDEIGALASSFNVMAAQIQEAQETLEGRVRSRTAELQRSLEDLRTAQDRLVQTEKLASLGQLTAGIAHEIKNPLNFVNNFAGVSRELLEELRATLENVELDGPARANVEELIGTLTGNLAKVVSHGSRADSIVKNMLLHSRAGSDERREIDVNTLVEESLNLAYHGARAEKPGFNVTIERALDPKAGRATVFPQEITRVLLNLLGNAFYATSKRAAAVEGPYEPTVSAKTLDRGTSFEIRIRDNGTGIPPHVRQKMFDPFYTTKPAGEGTGLGLSLSHDIVVKQHAGSLTVVTEPGAYTEFIIVLPRVASSAADGERS